MLGSIWDDVKRQYSYGNMVTRLILVNVAVFIFINLLWIILYHANAGKLSQFYFDFINFFAVSSELWTVVTHPWSIITNMFMHEGFWHILWNMLFLYWFGRIVGDLIGDRHILPLYILGGIAGVVIFVTSANLLPYAYSNKLPYALGASAGVMAIVVASGVLAPDYNFRLLFLGDVKLKFIAAAVIFIDLMGTANLDNTGGHFAHLGGAIFGWYYVWQMQKNGRDLSVSVNKVFDRIARFWDSIVGRIQGRRPKPRVVYRNKNKTRSFSRPHASSDTEDRSHQEELDAILDKIKKNGYDSLTEEEKEF
ncbi:MAG: rhomboid family intramembrane serine protease, partial [Bacteroidota bacterium]